MESQVPSPTHVKKSQHGTKVPTFEPYKTIEIRLVPFEPPTEFPCFGEWAFPQSIDQWSAPCHIAHGLSGIASDIAVEI